MFIGEYLHTIDNKNRVAIPAKFRNLLKGAVVTRGIDTCLVLYPRKEWEVLAGKIAAMPSSKAKNRIFSRLQLAGAMDVKIDKQGRIVLPDYLKKYARLNKKIAIAGLYDRLEIWDSSRWEAFKRTSEKESSEIAETLSELEV